VAGFERPLTKTRPASPTQPKRLGGDAPRQSLSLNYAKGVAKGEWIVPFPGDTQVLWTQPVYVTSGGETRWAEARVFRPSPPEEEKSDLPGSQDKKAVNEEKREAAAKAELKNLEGDWKLVRRETRGDLEPALDRLKLGLMIEDGHITWVKDGREISLTADIEVDPTTDPGTIDVEFTEGTLVGKKRLGIYELKGKKLTICWNDTGERKRPKKLTTRLAIGCGTVLETYQRIEE
jgi:uncharacterized protein (TIGR03067 family)